VRKGVGAFTYSVPWKGRRDSMKGNSKKGLKGPRGQGGRGKRRVLKETLQDSKELLARVLHSLSDAVFILDAATTKILECNPAACEVFGYSRGEMLGRTTAFLHVDEAALEEFRRHLHPAIEEKGFLHRFQFRMKRKDGSVFATEHNVTPLIDEKGKRVGWVSVVRDITEQKQAEEVLRESETRYRALFDATLDGAVVIDAETATILVANEAAAKMYGLESAKNAIGLSLLDFVAPEERERVVRIISEDLFEKDLREVNEFRTLTKDGREIWISALGVRTEYEGRVAGLISFRNATEHKRSEEALRHSEENFRALADNASDGILITWADGRVAYANRQAAEITGYSAGELLETNVKQLARPGDTKELLQRYKERLAGKPVPSRYETSIVRKDGEAAPTETAAARTTWQGKPAAMFFIRDITERKQAEVELRRAYERETKLRSELEEEMKKRAEFTRALVHELKTPLTSVIASSELLALELPEGPLLRMARNISRSAGNLNERIDELLDVARGELGMLRLNLMSVDPMRVLQGLAEDMGPIASIQHQSSLLDLPPSLPPVWADESRLRQVVLNLLSNACKFTGEGGKITLKAREKDDRLTVEVEDTGPGISEAEQQRLFTPYYRGKADKERFSGLGLGLALCKTLVELHKGQVWVRSQQGKGSTFGFSLPLATESQRGEMAEGDEEE
jgi:PAS domain S-box-containing protein